MKAPPRGTDRTRRILVVDDHRIVAETLTVFLSERGHETRAAGDGTRALDLATDLRPEVAIIDVGLPGMNGYELARRLRSAAPASSLKLVALTGSSDADTAREALASGFDHCLVKPADLDSLAALLERDEPAPREGPRL